MGLLAPLFLLGTLAIALPIWLHRLQSQSSERQSFSSAMLLKSSEEQIHVKRELKYLLLLALRVALILLLVLAFAQPIWNRPPTSIKDAAAGTHIVVVDTSVSMGRSGAFDQALEQARAAIDAAPAGALIQVLSAGDGLRIASELSLDRTLPKAALASLAAGTLRLDFGQLATEVNRFAESLPHPVTMHLVSDFQESGMPLRFSDLVAANISALVPWTLGAGTPFNWSIEFVRETVTGIEVGVHGFGVGDQLVEIEMRVNDGPEMMRSISGSGRHLLHFTDIEYAEGDNRVEVNLAVDDHLAADNHWYRVIRNDPPAAVPLITSPGGGLAATYLTAALESAAGGDYRVEPLMLGEFDSRVLSRYRWAVTDDIGMLGSSLQDDVTAFLNDGGSLLAFTSNRAVPLESLPISGHVLVSGNLAAAAGELMSVGQIDTQHPALADTEGWYRVNVSRTLPIELTDDDRVLMRLENNDPFIIERRVGEGRLLLVLSSADNRWNDLPLHPVFVGFIIETARYLSGAELIPDSYVTGANLPLLLIGSASGQVVDPDGREILSLADTARAQQIKLDKPGIYQVYTPQGETLVAANIDPRESRLAPMPDATLARWQDATNKQDNMTGSDNTMIESPPLELWRWLLLLFVLVIVGESILGNTYIATRVRAV